MFIEGRQGLITIFSWFRRMKSLFDAIHVHGQCCSSCSDTDGPASTQQVKQMLPSYYIYILKKHVQWGNVCWRGYSLTYALHSQNWSEGKITRTISNPHMWVVKTMGSCRFLPYIQWYTATLHISSISAENHWAGLGAKEKVYQEKENAPDTFAGGILVESVDQMSHWCCWLVMIYPIHWGLQSSMRGIPINQYDWISWMTQGLEHCDGVLRYPLVRR